MAVHQGGLDQWTLGHLPVHERMMEGEQTLGMPKASHALMGFGINRDGADACRPCRKML